MSWQSLWLKHKETILFNRALVIADTCSLILSALFAQYIYVNLNEDNVLDSILTAIVEYCIDTPIFFIAYCLDHRKKCPDCGFHVKYTKCLTHETRKMIGIFAVCDVMYIIIKIFVQFQFLNNVGISPYNASIISSLVAWAVYLILINITMKATRELAKDELFWYYTLVLIVSVANSIIFFSNLALRVFIDNIILDVSAGVAVAVGILIVIKRRKLNGVMPLSDRWVFPSILTGLILWFTAEIVWTYYQIVLNISNPFPSAADTFWLAGYLFFGFAFYTIFRNLIKIGRLPISKLTGRETYFMAGMGSMAVAIVVVISYLGVSMINPHDTILFPLSPKEFQEFIIALAYPLFDAILLVPVITIILSLRRIDPLHTHWILLCSFMILSTMGDIGFAYSELIYHDSAEDTVWIWDAFFNSSYICLVFALLWYRRFNIPLFEVMKKEKGQMQ